MTELLRSVAAIRIDPASLETYLDVHRQQRDAVREAMREGNILSYRMYLLRSQSMVISVSERSADTLEADRGRLAANPVMRDWLATCRPMQRHLVGEHQEPPSLWAPLPEVYSL